MRRIILIVLVLGAVWTSAGAESPGENRAAEARRFFDEYQRLVKSQGSGQEGEIEKFRAASDKLFAALSLAPNDEAIRYAELIYYSKMLRTVAVEKRTPAIRSQFERVKKFRADFPKSRSSVFGVDMLFGGCLTRDFSQYPEALKQEYTAICREYRSLNADEMKRLYYPYDLSDGINSLKDLKHYHDVVIRSNWDFNYFCDYEGWLTQRLADYFALYKTAEQYLLEHPDEAEKVNETIREGRLCDIFFPNQPLDRELLAEYLDNTKEFCRFVAGSDLDAVKPKAYLMDAMREMIRETSEEKYAQAIDRFLERWAALEPAVLRPRQSVWEYNALTRGEAWELREFCRRLIKRDTLPDQRIKAYQQRNGMSSDFEDVERLVMLTVRARGEEAFPELRKKAGLMQQFNIQHLKSNNFGNAYGAVAEHCFRGDFRGQAIDSDKMAFFKELNSVFAIESGTYRELTEMTGSNAPHLLGAAENSGEILLFLTGNRVIIRRADGTFEQQVSAPASLFKPERTHSIWKRPLAFSDSHIAYVDPELNLHLCDRKNKRWTKFADFSPEPVRSLLIHGDMLYALAGDEEWSVNNLRNYMFSCRLDGTGRKLLFSSERSEKLTELDHLRGGLSGLSARTDNELVFLLTYVNNYTYVWSYDIRENSFRMLSKMPLSGTDCDYLWKGRDGFVYWMSCGWGERLYRLKPGEETPEWIFSQTGGKRKDDPADAAPALFKGTSQMRGPWVVTGDYLWSGGDTSAFLNLKRIEENPPLLLLPQTRYVFELDDGRILFLGDYRYFIVKTQFQN